MSHNIALVERVYRAFEAGDAAKIEALFDPDIVLTQTPLLPWGGRYEGHQGAMDFFVALIGHTDSEVTIDRLFESGDHVVEVGRTSGTVTSNGAAFDINEVHVWTIRDGKITAGEFYIDTPVMLRALRDASMEGSS